ncbi:CD1247 N-terminal domain-containing protein [Clostridium taeniosporum]|uniref:Zinc ribbon domain-containing protein n=1 Tax=Clostridium taeniosporum TaxID=394958 RepID=A0A1D7XKQ4_9CLOT|nr:CD1247 N-terminal domain-containing protein [Clostridium taeniosporum]AOR23918.1 hypothetical protein BGI42_09350 [Clostridium taeniosporum]
MENLRNQINGLKSNLSKIESEEYKSYFLSVVSILEMMDNKIEELTVNQEAIEENIRFMDDDLSDLQEELFEEVSIDELNELEDEYVEATCCHCGNTIFAEQSTLKNNNEIPCPYCNKNIKG